MKPSRDRQFELLWERLIAAHRRRPEPEPGAGWQAGVMQALRRLPAGASEGPETDSIFVGQLVWRAAVAAGLAALVATAYVLAQPSGMDLIASLLVDDPIDGVIELAFNL